MGSTLGYFKNYWLNFVEVEILKILRNIGGDRLVASAYGSVGQSVHNWTKLVEVKLTELRVLMD